MRLLQFVDPGETSGRKHRVGLIDGEDVVDLTSRVLDATSIHGIYYNHGGREGGLEKAVEGLLGSGVERRGPSLADLLGNVTDRGLPHLTPPVTPPPGAPHKLRIWLAGVTHQDSAKLREIEAQQSTGQAVNVYDQKYRECAEGGIPELFAKTDPDDLVGHGGGVSRPADTQRLVPETELVTVYGLNADGQVERIGYTGGNDYTDNGIEAENPLNLPQAKNWYGGCASLGPILVTDEAFDDTDVPVSCEVMRSGNRVACKHGRTGHANLNMSDGLYHLERSLFSRLPLGVGAMQLLYWGTPIVFAAQDLADGLQVGDTVRMDFGEAIGILQNRVVGPPDIGQLAWLESRRKTSTTMPTQGS